MNHTGKRLSDNEILAGLRSARDQDEAIREIYRVSYDMVAVFVSENGGNQADADDVFQETVIAFVDLVRQDKFRGDSAIKTFVYAIARNIWYNMLKRRKLGKEKEVGYSGSLELTESVAQVSFDKRRAADQLNSIMDSLGENCRRILMLFYYENYSMTDLVTELKYENEQVIRNRKYKCLKKLGEMIGADQKLSALLKTILHG